MTDLSQIKTVLIDGPSASALSQDQRSHRPQRWPTAAVMMLAGAMFGHYTTRRSRCRPPRNAAYVTEAFELNLGPLNVDNVLLLTDRIYLGAREIRRPRKQPISCLVIDE